MMNDYQMRFLAGDRQRELRTEADRARLARSTRQAHRPQHPVGAPTVGAGSRRRPGWGRLTSLLARFAI